ncbi:MAG TPA: hypothetical protein DGG95_15735 [Cytophagales bacterium]|jgi:hypothetical protein|nr:hypothetical protein [Cytophagales bacterium]
MNRKLVTLDSFHGTIKPGKSISENENYWKLIGAKGTIVGDEEIDGKVLVLFECNLDDFKLENHNPIKNSLWIKKSDLKIEEEF